MTKYPVVPFPERLAHPDDQAQFVTAWFAEVEKNPTADLANHAARMVVDTVRDTTLVKGFIDKVCALPGIKRADIRVWDIKRPGLQVHENPKTNTDEEDESKGTDFRLITFVILLVSIMCVGRILFYIFGS